MSRTEGYLGLDRFRLLAAFLVVAGHIGPLLLWGDFPDYLLTRVIARVVVPFFFATTGFFLLSPYAAKKQRSFLPIRRFLKKTALVYTAAIALYLPVNLYAGHFAAPRPHLHFLKLLLVDGTLYHLWYLPAAMLGVLLVWLLLRHTSLPITTGVCVLLYAVGLFGDSYYGFLPDTSALTAFYQGIFAVSTYTRNGLFFAPIFLLCGVWAARGKEPTREKGPFILFLLFLSLMLIEGSLLYPLGVQRHDSMYVTLPLCLYCLFRWLLQFRGRSSPKLRSLSLLIYLLHPMVILLVRGAAKVLDLTAITVENSLVHFLLVASSSFLLSLCLLNGKAAWKKARPRAENTDRAWLEIDLEALTHNVQTLQSLLPADCRLMPAIKADAYGLGAIPIGKHLQRLGVDAFCVATLSEGIALRKSGLEGDILILGYIPPDRGHARLLRRHRLMQTVVDADHGAALNLLGIPLSVHLKIDTGMHRLGEPADHYAEIAALFSLKNLHIRGIYTKLCRCGATDADSIHYSEAQIAQFTHLVETLNAQGIEVPALHMHCSYGLLNHPLEGQAFARPGLAIYGVIDPTCCRHTPPDLRPIFQVKARVSSVKPVPAGEAVGYGSAFTAKGDMTLAVLTIGYADGLPKQLSAGKGGVLLGGQFAPYVGSICMDQAMVDVTGLSEVRPGDTAVILGTQEGQSISIVTLSQWADTIPNEVMSRFGARLARVYPSSQTALPLQR